GRDERDADSRQGRHRPARGEPARGARPDADASRCAGAGKVEQEVPVIGMQLADRRVAEWLFLLAFATYAYFYAGGGWHQNAGFAAGLAAAMNYLCIVALIFGRRMRFAVAAAVPLVALAAYQWACFGSPFRTSVATTDPRFLTHGSVFVAPSLDAFLGITISP